MNHGVYVQKNSPFYWWRYYDKYALNNKRKSFNTKIEIIPSDLTKTKKKKNGEQIKLQGTPELWRKIKAYRQSLTDKKFEFENNVQLKYELLLSQGYDEFKKFRSVPGSRKQIKQKTIINYDIAVKHMIAACGDKKIYKYSGEKDYVALLHYFDKIKVPGKTIIDDNGKEVKTFKKMSINTKSIYTRSLRSLWNYFCDKNYAVRNIIEPVESEEKDPSPIPLDEMHTIISYFQQDYKHSAHYQFIFFLLLTGCRPSSAIVQLKENIDFKRKIITIKNVKTGKIKGKEFYKFPLYKELEKLIREAQVKPGDTGRLFHQFKLNELNYTYPLSFWERGIKVLKMHGKISQYYTLKQIRSTTASYLINVLKMDIYTVKKLLDHASVKVTDKHYLELNLKKVREYLDDFNFDEFMNDTNLDQKVL